MREPAALADVADRAALLVDGRWRPGGGGTYSVVNPATEQPVGRAADATAADAAEAAESARRAAAEWRAVPLRDRAAVLAVAADMLEAYGEALADLVVAETGATRAVAETSQVAAASTRLRRYASTTEADLVFGVPAGKGFESRREPLGVVACISPYNFPLLAMVGKVAPALVAGNTVVLKPAPQAPLAVVALADALDRALREAGAPRSAVQLVTGRSPEAGEALVASPHVAMVSFTGSTAVGQRIAATGAATMKRLLLELGGKAACVIAEDADLDAAATALARTWTVHAGQVCLAPTRAVVHRSRHAELVERLRVIGESLVVGDPRVPTTDVGPLISAAQRDRVHALVEAGIAAGATSWVFGPEALPERGHWYRPTLLDGCDAANPAAGQEIFGPVLTVLPVADDDEAVEVANSTPYGLYDYVFSRDVEHAQAIADRLEAAQVAINTHVRPPEAPFGGAKASGLGRAGGILALHAYTELHTIVGGS